MSLRFFETTSHAEVYAKYRPSVPPSIADKIVSFLKEKYEGPLKKAIDVGCGSGQSSMVLASHFEKVLGVDVSPSQIEEAKKRNTLEPQVEFMVSPAENLPVEDSSLQLVAAGTAFHFFDAQRFAKEVDRVLQPGGVAAVYVNDFPYPVHSKGSQLRDIVKGFFNETAPELLKDYPFDFKERNTNFAPFPETVRDTNCYASIKGNGTIFKGYLRTWSSVEAYFQKNGEEKGEQLLEDFCQKILAEMGVTTSLEETPMELRFDYVISMSRKPL